MSLPFDGQGTGRRDTPVTSQILEERINVYISAMDRALSMNDTSMSSQLQRDIQQLVDLMEKVQSGQTVIEKDVPPPLVMTPMNDVLANPLGELSSRLSDYHKALYFAEEELSEDRINKIQTLQKGLQTIHSLQKRAQAGFPIREDEVPPPVVIPSDSEFDENAVKTITERLEQYNAALKICQESSGADRRRVSKLQSGIRTLEFLLTRAKAKRPVWQKDIPAEFEYFSRHIDESSSGKSNAKLTIQLRSLMTRVSKVKCERPEQQNVAKELDKKLISLMENLSTSSSPQKLDIQSLVHQVEALELMADIMNKDDQVEKSKSSESALKHPEDLALVVTRIKEYKDAAVKAKQEGRVNIAIKHLKVVKGLKSLKETLDRGASVDMTLVPPPPKDDTPVANSPPPLPTVSDSIQPVTAHAQLTEVRTKPIAVESDKSKLARKLATYLEQDMSPNSTSSSSFDSDSVPSPKEETSDSQVNSPSHHVPTSESSDSLQSGHSQSDGETSAKTQSHKVSLDNIGFVSCGSSSGSEDAAAATKFDQTNENEVKRIQGSEIDEEADSKNLEIESPCKLTSVVESKSVVVNNDTEIQCRTDAPPKPPEQNRSQQESSSNRHLDSIGFLSCQNVPSFSPSTIQNESSHSTNTVGASDSSFAQDKSITSSEIKVPNMNTSGLPSTEEANLSTNVSKFSDQTINLSTDTICHPVDKSESVAGSAKGVNDSHVVAAVPKEQENDKSQTADLTDITSQGESSLEQVNEFSSTVDNVLHNNMSTSDQGNSIQPNQLNYVGDKPLTSNTNISGNTKISEAGKRNKEITILNKNTSLESSPECNSLRHQNVEVNGLKEDSAVKKSNGNEDTPKHSAILEEDALKVSPKKRVSEGVKDVQNFQDISTTDAEEFADLINSMSLSETRSEIQFSSLPHQTTEPLNDVKSKLNSVESSESTFHSLPPSFPVSSTTNSNSNASTSKLTGVSEKSSKSPELHKPSALATSNVPASSSSQLANIPLGSFIKTASDSCTNRQEQFGPPGNMNSNSSPFTCLETLKYDILIAEAKKTEENRKEADKLGLDMEAIKDRLRTGRRKVWDEYKNRVEYELQVLNIGLKQCGETQNWEEYKYLNSKRMLNEKELALLNQRICEIQD